jgi:hypothetical protein
MKLKKKDRTLGLSHGTLRYVRMYINAVSGSVMLYLHHFYNTIFKIKHKLYVALESAPHQGKILGARLDEVCVKF